jgi:hypothetical protein
MEFLKNIEWYIRYDPKTAIRRDTKQPLTKEEWELPVFEQRDTLVKLSFVLNDNYLFFETRDIRTPVNVKKLLKFIYIFYQDRLNPENLDKAFEEMEELKEEVLERYEGDVTEIRNIDVLTDTCEPDFCGLEFLENGEYAVHIGPE